MERDRYGYVEFVYMQSVPMLFNEKPSFSEFVVRAQEELHCHGDDGITVDGVLHLGSFPSQHPKEDDSNWVCRLVGELCEIVYEVSVPKFGRGCALGFS